VGFLIFGFLLSSSFVLCAFTGFLFCVGESLWICGGSRGSFCLSSFSSSFGGKKNGWGARSEKTERGEEWMKKNRMPIRKETHFRVSFRSQEKTHSFFSGGRLCFFLRPFLGIFLGLFLYFFFENKSKNVLRD